MCMHQEMDHSHVPVHSPAVEDSQVVAVVEGKEGRIRLVEADKEVGRLKMAIK